MDVVSEDVDRISKGAQKTLCVVCSVSHPTVCHISSCVLLEGGICFIRYRYLSTHATMMSPHKQPKLHACKQVGRFVIISGI